MGDFVAGLTGVGLLTVLEVLLVAVALVVAPRGRRPSSALAWILLITLLPLVGMVLFALIGSPYLPRSRREKQQHMDDRIAERHRDLDDVSRSFEAPRWLPSVVFGGDYARHDGRIQDIVGNVFPTTRSAAMVGVGPSLVFTTSEVGECLSIALTECSRSAGNDAATPQFVHEVAHG